MMAELTGAAMPPVRACFALNGGPKTERGAQPKDRKALTARRSLASHQAAEPLIRKALLRKPLSQAFC